MTDQAITVRPSSREVRVVEDVIPILDTARFEHIQRIASAMANSSLIPATLRGEWATEGREKKLVPFDHQTVVANVFRVVNQAVRWNMDPFSVVDCCSVVHGRLMYEGKLVHAVVEARLGIRLRYQFGRMTEVTQPSGAVVRVFDPSEEGPGVFLAVRIIGQFDDEEEPRTIEGTVEDWKTSGANSPWGNEANFKRQLRYRGAREWARAHAPGTLLGVVTDDEIEGDLVVQERVTSSRRQPKVKAPSDIVGKLTAQKAQEGFDPDHVERETATTPDGTIHDATTGEIIQGQAVEGKDTGTDGVQSAETTPATSASAEGASEGSQAATSGDPQSDDTSNVSTAWTEELEELDRLAYQDGFEGEPIAAILSECDTDQEREIATDAHARGVADKAAQADDVALNGDLPAQTPSEAAQGASEPEDVEFEPEDVAGPAPKDALYILQQDTPMNGLIPVYQNGKMLTKPVALERIAKDGLKRYDGHPEPTDPALASQSGGTGVVEPKPKSLYEEIAGMGSWLEIKPRLGKLYQSDDFKALEPADQAATRANLFKAVLEMKDRTRDPVDWATDVSAFLLWADHTLAKGLKDGADEIEGTFQVLQDSDSWTKKLNAGQQQEITARVAGMISKLKGN